jgi:hypothetical protein
MLRSDERASVVQLLTQLYPHAKFTTEQLVLFGAVIEKANSVDVAVDALELMAQEDVRFPMPFDYRERLERVHRRLAQQQPALPDRGIPACCPGSFDEAGFVHWWHAHASDQSKAEARRAATGLGVMARWVKAAEA